MKLAGEFFGWFIIGYLGTLVGRLFDLSYLTIWVCLIIIAALAGAYDSMVEYNRPKE